ncbi:MAG: zinc-ribbon domain-containing protein [Deltaproteobacteria bacterium]|nr:zinc-ribbon domain-containing protein [Deltaproteobacteria bacterium]
MIAACPKCAARYRIDKEKLGEGGARLRCSRCDSVFRVRAPADTPASAQADLSKAAPPVEKKRAQVVVAMPDADLAKHTADALGARGLHCMVVFDGVDAMLEIQRQEPAAVVLAAELPKMFGFQVCEIVKRNASLRGTHVILAGAVHHPERYRRSPSELYGADSYVEVPDLPDALFPLLEEAGVLPQRTPSTEKPGSAPLRPMPGPPVSKPEPSSSPPAPSLAPAPAQEQKVPFDPDPRDSGQESLGDAGSPDSREGSIPTSNASAPQEPVAPPESPSTAPPEERAQAERLARIIVSDIVLYNEEKFSAAVAAGDVAQAMAAELDEGRGLFERRVDEAVRAKNDFLLEELLRVARARGMA